MNFFKKNEGIKQKKSFFTILKEFFFFFLEGKIKISSSPSFHMTLVAFLSLSECSTIKVSRWWPDMEGGGGSGGGGGVKSGVQKYFSTLSWKTINRGQCLNDVTGIRVGGKRSIGCWGKEVLKFFEIGIKNDRLKIEKISFLGRIDLCMDKLQLAGRNLGRVFNCISGCMCPKHLLCYEAKQANLKLKIRPKQLLGSLLIAFALPGLWFETKKA